MIYRDLQALGIMKGRLITPVEYQREKGYASKAADLHEEDKEVRFVPDHSRKRPGQAYITRHYDRKWRERCYLNITRKELAEWLSS